MQFDSDLFSVVFFAVVFKKDASVLDFGIFITFVKAFVLPLLLGIRGKSQMKITEVQNVRFLPFKRTDYLISKSPLGLIEFGIPYCFN